MGEDFERGAQLGRLGNEFAAARQRGLGIKEVADFGLVSDKMELSDDAIVVMEALQELYKKVHVGMEQDNEQIDALAQTLNKLLAVQRGWKRKTADDRHFAAGVNNLLNVLLMEVGMLQSPEESLATKQKTVKDILERKLLIVGE